MESTNQYPMGVNRFECRSCPYEHVVEHEYYERTEVKQKEVEDVFGGKEEFANADSIASAWSAPDLLRSMQGWVMFPVMAFELTDFSAAQCPAEDCNGERAYFFQLQIRSADEPMTTFLKVRPPYMVQRSAFLTADAVYDVRCPVERELIWQKTRILRWERRGGPVADLSVSNCFIAKWRILGWQALEISQRVQFSSFRYPNRIDVRTTLILLRSAVPWQNFG